VVYGILLHWVPTRSYFAMQYKKCKKQLTVFRNCANSDRRRLVMDCTVREVNERSTPKEVQDVESD
jgi:hypothetical protein